VDVATRTICAAVLRPENTKAVDARLLLARMLVPEPMRPGWPEALAASASALPYRRLVNIDERFEHAAAKPVIVPETITIDQGKVFLSGTWHRQGVHQPVERGRRRYWHRAFAVFCGQGLFDPPVQPGLGAGRGVRLGGNCLLDGGDQAFIGTASWSSSTQRSLIDQARQTLPAVAGPHPADGARRHGLTGG
jgi:hypothetical protein